MLLSECRGAPAAAMVDGKAWDDEDIRGSVVTSCFSLYGGRRFLLRNRNRKSKPISAMPARLPVIPPAIAAECLELPSGLTSREPCPPPPATAPLEEVAADEEVFDVVDVVSCVVLVDTGESAPAGTVRVLVTYTIVLTVVVECVVTLAVVVVEKVVG